MDPQASLEDLRQMLQKKREQKERAEKEVMLLEERLQTAKLRRSSSQQHRFAKFAPGRRQPAHGLMGDGRRATIGTTMNRSFTTQATPVGMDRNLSMSSDISMPPMPSVREHQFGGIGPRLSQDEPANVLMLHRANRLADVGEYPTPDCGQNPMDFLSNNFSFEDDFVLSATTSSQPMPPTANFFSCTEIPPSSAPSLVSGESIATAMSRESSSAGGSVLQPQELTQSDSALSPSLERYPSHEIYGITNAQPTQNPGKSRFNVSNDMLVGMGGSFSAASQSVEMSRTISNISNCSARSTASNQEKRAKEARERQIQNSLRNQIAPKPSDDSEKSDSSSTSVSKKDGKMPVPKKEYIRPKHARVQCKKCNEHPLGFRGQHELTRHILSKHAEIVTRWECRDPRTCGIATSLVPVTPLNKCKACQTRKSYGAYYNAAAHMRRAHFKPKTSRKQGKKHCAPENHGKVGSDAPTMAELKKWMVQVQVRADSVDEDESFEAEPADVDVNDELDFDYRLEYQNMPELSMDPRSPDTSTSISSGSPAFEMPLPQIGSDMAFADMLDATYSSPSGISTNAMMDYSAIAEDFSMSMGIAT